MSSGDRVILFAGGGSGGHIFPNVAILERLRENRVPVGPHFLVSDRNTDAMMLKRMGYPYTALSAQPFRITPAELFSFYQGFKQARRETLEVIRRTGAVAMVATGGFVSAPAVAAARLAKVPVALVNLDATPGKANRRMAKDAAVIFSVYDTDKLPKARTIGVPLRRSSLAMELPGKARYELGLRPELNTLFITAGSQGAMTINRLMMELCTRTEARKALGDWQVLHLTGERDREEVAAAYRQACIRAVVEPFCNHMGLAWSAATLAISRAGAGSVAEVWANAVPTIFLPYPFHRDQHQRRNCEPLVNAGAALLMSDRIDPIVNASQLIGPLSALMRNITQRERMAKIMRDNPPRDGATAIARWLMMGLGVRR